MKPNSRIAAVEILSQWEQKNEPVDTIRDHWLHQHPTLAQRDKDLAMALVYGVIRRRGYLDKVISGFSRHPLAKMKPVTLQALRIGLYQLLFMDRIPDSAAINESVNTMRAAGQPKWLIGFVNGVLRSMARGKEKLPDPDSIGGSISDWDILSHPEWLFKRWLARYGHTKAVQYCQRNNQLPVLSLCVNPAKTTVSQYLEKLVAAGIPATQGQYSPLGVLLPEYKGGIKTLPGYDQGLFQVQDEAAQLIPYLLQPYKPVAYLDACAGLGGKTLQIARLLPEGGTLTAVEPNHGRVRLLRENLNRQQLADRVTILEGELAGLDRQFNQSFAGVLVDAPCSGLGVIRRHPDIRWNRSGADLIRYQEIQQKILAEAAQLTAPGGILVYATCSLEPEENETVVEQFVAQNSKFSLEDCTESLPDTARRLVDKQGYFKTGPDDESAIDGFFAARLVNKQK